MQDRLFGMRDGIPITGDFNGDGVTEMGVFHEGQWFVDLNGNGIWDDEDLWAELGEPGDLPVTGDWDGDGKTDIGVYGVMWPGDPQAVAHEPGLPDAANEPTGEQKNVPPLPEEATTGWRTLKHTAAGALRADVIDHVFAYGDVGDVPVSGDFNGDGIDTVGLFNDGVWTLDANGDGRWQSTDKTCEFGKPGDVPVVADFDGNGVDELAVFRKGRWIVDSNRNRAIDAQDKVFELGGPGDLPVVGDFNGDGIEEAGIYQRGESLRAAR